MESFIRAARPAHGSLRAPARFATPVVYLVVFAGLQLAYLWWLRPWFGLTLRLSATAAFLLLLGLLVVELHAWRWKEAVLWLLVGLLTIAPALVLIASPTHGGATFQHDGLVQTEAAIDRILHGQRIYGVDWSGTALGQYDWRNAGLLNPALHHHVYLPLTALMGVPFVALSRAAGLPFDYRIVLVMFVVIALVAVASLPTSAPRRFMVVVALLLNPLIIIFYLSGRNDICYLALLLVTLALLARGRPVAASFACGVAVALKPFALLAVPFLLAALWVRWDGRPLRHRREGVLAALALAATPVLSIAPFFLADPGAFWRDTVLFTNGSGPDAYPISGFGFGALLLSLHLVPGREAAFPFGVFQLAAVLPVGFWGVRALLARPTLQRWLVGYTSLLLAFAFFARFFNDSYVGVVVALFMATLAVGDAPIAPLAGSRSQPRVALLDAGVRGRWLRADRLPWLLIAAYALLSVAWVFGNPPGAAPDEPAHYVKALAAGQWKWVGRKVAPLPAWQPPPPYDAPEAQTNPEQLRWLNQTTRVFEIPAALSPGSFACNAFRPELTAACLRDPSQASAESSVADYPPFLYVVPGAVMRAAPDASKALLLGRLVNAALALMFVGAAIWVLWCRQAPALSLLGVLVSVSPMVVFLTSGLSASGLEIASGLCLFACVIRLARSWGASRFVWMALAGSGGVLMMSRQLGPLWVALGVLFAIATLGWRSAWARVREGGRASRLALAGIATALVLNFSWELAVRAPSPTQPDHIPHELVGSLGELRWLLPSLLRQGIGVFGWLDTTMPAGAYLAWGVILLMVLGTAYRMGSQRNRWTLTVMILSGIALVLALSALLMRPIGFRPQARQLLPVATALPLFAGELILLHRRRFASLRPRNLVFYVAILAGAVQGLAWYTNARRHAVGAPGPWLFLGHEQWSPPLGWRIWLLAVMVATTALVAFGVLACVIAGERLQTDVARHRAA